MDTNLMELKEQKRLNKMLTFFKENQPKDIKGIRSALLQFIKEQLQKAEGGEGGNIRGMCLYVTCSDTDKHLYDAALYADEEDRFKSEEVQRIADDFAIALPEGWTFDISFDQAPPEAVRAVNIDAALFISTRKKPLVHKEATAFLKVMNGEAEKEVYTINSTDGKINIGRERRVQTADGFFRENVIAFPDKSSNEANRSVSRQHAHIEWDPQGGVFCLYADEGGIPPMNKMKVRDAAGNIAKIQTVEIAHQLQPGDQIMLGESVVLEFSYKA
jgi:pSer/pThr/pTyr-binding forkhead associated (FHA) protein